MQCPHCDETALVMSERQGIEIDYCPRCRGVWLDRGELDKIIDRAAAQAGAGPARPPATLPPPSYRQDRQAHGHAPRTHEHGHRKKKREGFLSDLFDF